MSRKIFIWIIAVFVVVLGIIWLSSTRSSRTSNSLNRITPVQTTPTPPLTKSWQDFKYITPVDWPPKVTLVEGRYSCAETGSETIGGGKTEEETINGTKYCVTVESQGAAGSIYLQYAFVKDAGSGKLKIATFSIRQVQCGNYPQPQMAECEKERTSFNIDEVVASTLINE